MSSDIRRYQYFVKCVQILSFFWSVFSRIRTEYGKKRTRKNSVFGHFSRSADKRRKKKDFLKIC